MVNWAAFAASVLLFCFADSAIVFSLLALATDVSRLQHREDWIAFPELRAGFWVNVRGASGHSWEHAALRAAEDLLLVIFHNLCGADLRLVGVVRKLAERPTLA